MDSKTALNFTLFCSYGKMDEVDSFGQSLLTQKSTCAQDGLGIKFSPEKCTYSLFNETYEKKLDDAFKAQCNGKDTCNLIVNKTFFPTSNCTIDPFKNQSAYVYFVQATCKSSDINFLLLDKIYLKKEIVAFVVVIADVAAAFIMFFLFQYLRAMQLKTNQEITEAVVQAQDFTVAIKNLPDHDNIRALKAYMWNHIENVNEKDPKKKINQTSGIEQDMNQDTLMSMHYGLSDYGRMRFMLEMAELLKVKKKFETMILEEPQNKEKYQKEIDKSQVKAKEILKNMETYA